MKVKYFLSIDCGLTKLKVNLFDTTGNILKEEQSDTPLENLLVKTYELKSIITGLIKRIIADSSVSPKDISAISASGHGNGLYIVGENGVFEYGYSSMFTDSLPYTPATDEVFNLINQTSWSGQPLPILSYLKNEKPDVFRKIKKICFCKDIINFFLTEKVLTDYTDASAAGLLNSKTSYYDAEILKHYSLEKHMDLLPEITASTDIIGTVCGTFASETGLSVSTKVLGGMFDVNACMLGAGVVDSDKYCIIGGTWGINSAVVNKSVSNKSITQCCNFLFSDRFMCIDSAPTSCSNLHWFLKNILNDTNYETANKTAENQKSDENLFSRMYTS